MRLWICLLASGCFPVTNAAYKGLVRPNRLQLADEVLACSVREAADDSVHASVAIRLEHGVEWLYDQDGGLAVVRQLPEESPHPPSLTGRRFSRGDFAPGDIPCTLVSRRGEIAAGADAWHFDEHGYREAKPRPITAEDLRHSAFVVYDRSPDRLRRSRLFISVPPRSGRSSTLVNDDCMACRDGDGLIIGTVLATPGWPSKGGMAAFAFFLPITLGFDLLGYMMGIGFCSF